VAQGGSFGFRPFRMLQANKPMDGLLDLIAIAKSLFQQHRPKRESGSFGAYASFGRLRTWRAANRASRYWGLLFVLASHAVPTLAPLATFAPKGMPAAPNNRSHLHTPVASGDAARCALKAMLATPVPPHPTSSTAALKSRCQLATIRWARGW
jgi:hypothetical protein